MRATADGDRHRRHRNLGKLFAQSLAGDGANVMVHYNSPEREGEAASVVGDLEGLGIKAASHEGDLTDIAKITQLVDATVERFGRWDILVNTAGLIVRKPLAETTEKEFDDSFAINTKIPYFFMHEAFDKMADNGRIINIVTTQVAFTAATYSAYAGSKASVEHFTKAFAKEIGPRGVTVNCIAPGPQKTSFFYNAENDETIACTDDLRRPRRPGRRRAGHALPRCARDPLGDRPDGVRQRRHDRPDQLKSLVGGSSRS